MLTPAEGADWLNRAHLRRREHGTRRLLRDSNLLNVLLCELDAGIQSQGPVFILDAGEALDRFPEGDGFLVLAADGCLLAGLPQLVDLVLGLLGGELAEVLGGN